MCYAENEHEDKKIKSLTALNEIREYQIDQAIDEAEEEFLKTGEAIDVEKAFDELEKKYN